MAILAPFAEVAQLASLRLIALGEDVPVFTVVCLIWHAPLLNDNSTLLGLAPPLGKVVVPGVLSLSLVGTCGNHLFQLLILDFLECLPI